MREKKPTNLVVVVGNEDFHLSPSTALILKQHHEGKAAICAMVGKTFSEDDLVCCKVDGTPLLPDSVSHAWANLAKRVGLQGNRLHDVRHSRASLMLKQSIHPKIIQERLGRSSIQTTLDTYSHVAPGLQEAAAARFDEAFARKQRVDSAKELG